jgi:hypothetical protein
MLVALAGVAGCFPTPRDPVAPTWDVSLTAPVTSKSYSLGELSERNPSMFAVTPGTGGMVYMTSGSVAPVPLGDLLGLRSIDVSGSASFGPIALGPVQASFAVQVPGLAQGSPVPPIASLPLPSIDVGLQGFQAATMHDGTLELRLQNNLPADIVLESPIVLRDSAGSVACTFVFVPNVLPAGQARSATAPLAGATLTSRASLTGVLLSTAGSTAPVAAGAHLAATLTGSDLSVDRALLAVIQPQTLVGALPVAFPLTDSTRIQFVQFASGTITLDASSEAAIPVVVRFAFEDLYAASGQRFADSVALPARGSEMKSIPLAGLTLRTTDGSLLDALRLSSTVSLSAGSAGQPVDISSSDRIVYRLRLTGAVLDSMIGVLKPTAVLVDDGVALDWGDLEGNFRASMVLPSATLAFNPSTVPGVPIYMDLRLEADRPNGAGTAVLPFPDDAYKADGGPVVFDQAQVGNFLAQIVEHLPPTVRLAGTVVLNPYYDTSRRLSVGSRSTVGGDIDLSVPLTLSIRGGAVLDTAVIGDTTSDGTVDRWLDQGTLEALNAGQITLDVENALPLSFTLKFALLDLGGRPLLDLPQGVVDSVRVGPALMVNGSVVAPSRHQAVFELSADEIRRVNPSRYLQFVVSLQTPGPGLVSFRSSDRLTVRSWARFSYTVDP